MSSRLIFLPAVALTILPWVNPLASGPSAAIFPWLISAACAASLLMLRPSSLPQWVATAWLIAALLSVGAGLIQYVGAADYFSGWVNASPAGHAFANLRQRNQFASLTNMGLLALIYVVRAWGLTGLHVNGLAVVAAVLLGVGNAAASSRTGLLQLAVLVLCAGLMGIWRAKAVRHILVAAVTGYAAATVVLPLLIGASLGEVGILGRFNEQAMGCQSRRVLWDNVLTLIGQKPWLGWGWGELDYAHFITLYPGPPDARFCDILDNAHNLPLHLAVELGVPFAAFVCLALAGAVTALRPWRELHPARQMAWGVLLVIGLHSLLEYPLWYGPFQIAVGLCVLILWQTHRRLARLPHRSQAIAPGTPPPQSSQLNRRIVDVGITSVAIFFISNVAYAMWDYYRISQIYRAPAERAVAYRYNTFEKIRGSWLYQNHVQFAELTTTPVTAVNAAHVYAQASRLLHFSPEARVVEKLIESAALLGLNDEVVYFKKRYEKAYAQAFARWQAGQVNP